MRKPKAQMNFEGIHWDDVRDNYEKPLKRIEC